MPATVPKAVFGGGFFVVGLVCLGFCLEGFFLIQEHFMAGEGYRMIALSFRDKACIQCAY